jgi:hypothetical protein
MTAISHAALLERIWVGLRRGVGRACRAPGDARRASGRDDLARLGLLALGDPAGTDELSRLALLPIGGLVRDEVPLFARVVSTGSDSL